MKKGVVSILSGLTGAILGAVAGAGTVAKVIGEADCKTKELAEKHLALYLMMNQWVKVKQEGKNLCEYFEKNGYHKIAIYGMSYAGETLLAELKDSQVKVVYGIDRNAEEKYADVDVVSIDDTLDEVDVIVVTAITFFDEIEEKLRMKVDYPIISLEDILYSI